VTLGDRPLNGIDLLATPGSNFAKRQFRFVVFISYIILLYFIL